VKERKRIWGFLVNLGKEIERFMKDLEKEEESWRI